jgi:hypothetical protein
MGLFYIQTTYNFNYGDACLVLWNTKCSSYLQFPPCFSCLGWNSFKISLNAFPLTMEILTICLITYITFVAILQTFENDK